MSRDNTVAILRTEAGYRVAEVQAVENLWCDDFEFRNYCINAHFGDKPLIQNKSEAWVKAGELYEAIVKAGGYVEYGVKLVDLTNFTNQDEFDPETDYSFPWLC